MEDRSGIYKEVLQFSKKTTNNPTKNGENLWSSSSTKGIFKWMASKQIKSSLGKWKLIVDITVNKEITVCSLQQLKLSKLTLCVWGQGKRLSCCWWDCNSLFGKHIGKQYKLHYHQAYCIPEKTPSCMILTAWNYGKGKIMETVKRSIVARGSRVEREKGISGAQGIFRAVGLLCSIL